MFAHSLQYNQSYRYRYVIQWYYYNKRWHHMNGYINDSDSIENVTFKGGQMTNG